MWTAVGACCCHPLVPGAFFSEYVSCPNCFADDQPCDAPGRSMSECVATNDPDVNIAPASIQRMHQRCTEYCFNKLHNPCIPVCKVSCRGCDPSVAAGGPTRLPGLEALSHQYCRSLTVTFGSVKFVMYTSQTLALTTAGQPPSLLHIGEDHVIDLLTFSFLALV